MCIMACQPGRRPWQPHDRHHDSCDEDDGLIGKRRKEQPEDNDRTQIIDKAGTKNALPYSVLLKPVSNITLYTTAVEVVDSAMPQSQLALASQPKT